MIFFTRLIKIIVAIILLKGSAFAQTSSAPSQIPTPTPPPSAVSDNASPGEQRRTEVQINYTSESLTNGFGKWRSASVDFSHKFSQRKTLYGSYRETDRLKQRDREFVLGYYHPLSRKWLLLVEAGASPSHKVLPKWSALVQVERNFKNGWNLQGGYRRTEFNTAKVNLGIAGFEKYWGNYRAAYNLYINNLQNGGTSASQRFQFNRYYGDPVSSVGISFGFGRELENLGVGRGVLRTEVQSFSVSGQHFFNRRWGLNYGLVIHRQGNLYNRRGGQIGLRFRF